MLNLSLNGFYFSLSGEDYIKETPYYCYLRIQSFDLGFHNQDTWLIGDPFLRKYYTIYDIKEERIGIALASRTKQGNGVSFVYSRLNSTEGPTGIVYTIETAHPIIVLIV